MRLTKCPVCGGNLTITQLTCKSCSLKMRGKFENCEFCELSEDSLNFLRSFIRCRGVIKDVEKELGISYPTVRSRLDRLVAELGYGETPVKSRDEQRYDLLEAVKEGRISSKEAITVLRDIR